MKSEWRVSSNPIGGGKVVYQVYRLKDTEKLDHSGNREVDGVFDSRRVAQERVNRLNGCDEDAQAEAWV